METIIESTKEIIKRQVELNYPSETGSFLRCQKVFPWTNENVNAYLKYANFAGKKSALSVLASGDQAFNLITNGIMNIDTFDINPLTEYFVLGLKRALILKYDFEIFNEMLRIIYSPGVNFNIINSLIRGLFPYMDLNYRIFWEKILDYNYKIQKENNTDINLVLMLVFRWRINPYEINNFLISRENYELLRYRLGQANITFQQANALSIYEVYKQRYDFILLSNVFDYFHQSIGPNWDYLFLKEYEKKLESIADEDALIFLHYIFCYLSDNEQHRKNIINNSMIQPSDLLDEKIVTIPSENGFNDGMILKRIK